jgi:predicted phage-related endonuclease
VAGVDQYKTPLRVYAEKLTDIDADESPIMRRGRMFEAAAIEYIREDHIDFELQRPNAFYSDVDLKLGATPDLLAACSGRGRINIQIKTVSAPVFEGWEGKPPTAYVLQTVAENLLTNADEGILAVLVVSAYAAELHEFPVPRHEGAEKRICEIARQFWANVKKGVVPRPDYRMDGDVLAKMYQPDPEVETPLDLTGDNRILEVLEQREDLKASIKAQEADVKAFDAEIIHKLGGATLATINGWKITNKLTHRKEYTVAAAEFPRLLVSRSDTMEAAQ